MEKTLVKYIALPASLPSGLKKLVKVDQIRADMFGGMPIIAILPEWVKLLPLQYLELLYRPHQICT